MTRKRSALRGLASLLIRAARRSASGGNARAAFLLLRLASKTHDSACLRCRLARVAFRLGDYPAAFVAIQRALTMRPSAPNLHASLARFYLKLSYPLSARRHASAAAALDPSCVSARLTLADLAAQDGDSNGAIALLEKACSIAGSPRVAAVAAMKLGGLYKDRAQRGQAIEYWLVAAHRQPDSVRAYQRLSEAGFYEPSHPHIEVLKRLAASRTLPRDERAAAHFSLGRIYDEHGRYDAAFHHFQRGNTLRRRRYSPRTAKSDFQRRARIFSRELVETLSEFGHESDAPIFVVGMPRSGTTLVEQILDSHPEVRGLGERLDIFDAVRQLTTTMAWTKRPYPECVVHLNTDHVRRLSESIFTARGGAEHAFRTVTKRPDDFWELGLIHVLFPRARIIHCRRGPLDTCLSCFMQDFASIPYASRLDHLATYYREYRRMMSHWRSVLDPGTLYEVDYESLVTNPRKEIERLLRFCGLAPHESCCRFFENTRAVATASVWQVRRPLYTTSIGRWKNYERLLPECVRSLGRELVDVDTVPQTSVTADPRLRPRGALRHGGYPAHAAGDCSVPSGIGTEECAR